VNIEVDIADRTEGSVPPEELEKLGTAKEVAEFLTRYSHLTPHGERVVDARLVHSWFTKREKLGFPEPAGTRRTGSRSSRVWKLGDVLKWYSGWKPDRGGAPKGNQNALRHGRFVGARASREARRTGSAQGR